MDVLNRKILTLLLNDSRLSFRQIASKLKISTATAAARIRKMEKNGIIKKYSASLDYGKLGYETEALVLIRTLKGADELVIKRLLNQQNVHAVYDIIGDFELAALVKFETRKKLYDFLQKIRSYDFIERTKTILILGSFKEENMKL